MCYYTLRALIHFDCMALGASEQKLEWSIRVGWIPLDCNDKSRPFLGRPQIWICSLGPTASPAPGEERLSLYIFAVYQGKPSHQIRLIITKRSFTGEHPGRLVVNQIRRMVSFSHQDVT